jgi:hypothetical protein
MALVKKSSRRKSIKKSLRRKSVRKSSRRRKTVRKSSRRRKTVRKSSRRRKSVRKSDGTKRNLTCDICGSQFYDKHDWRKHQEKCLEDLHSALIGKESVMSYEEAYEIYKRLMKEYGPTSNLFYEINEDMKEVIPSSPDLFNNRREESPDILTSLLNYDSDYDSLASIATLPSEDEEDKKPRNPRIPPQIPSYEMSVPYKVQKSDPERKSFNKYSRDIEKKAIKITQPKRIASYSDEYIEEPSIPNRKRIDRPDNEGRRTRLSNMRRNTIS